MLRKALIKAGTIEDPDAAKSKDKSDGSSASPAFPRPAAAVKVTKFGIEEKSSEQKTISEEEFKAVAERLGNYVKACVKSSPSVPDSIKLEYNLIFRFYMEKMDFSIWITPKDNYEGPKELVPIPSKKTLVLAVSDALKPFGNNISIWRNELSDSFHCIILDFQQLASKLNQLTVAYPPQARRAEAPKMP